MISDAGLQDSRLRHGGFLNAAEESGRQEALESNKAAIREARALGTSELIMVVGGLPAAAHVLGGNGDRSDKDLVAARDRVAKGLAELVPYALKHGVRLVLEALHPMY